MKLSEVKTILGNTENVSFADENGNLIPLHFHITEVGVVVKHFIDCGGSFRSEKKANLQLWVANDTEHRMTADKFLKIIKLSEGLLGTEDLPVEVEYQGITIGKYDLDHNGQHFVLRNTKTACLAEDACGIPGVKQKVVLSEIKPTTTTCTPGGGCC